MTKALSLAPGGMFLALFFLFVGGAPAHASVPEGPARLRYVAVPENPRPGYPVTIGVTDGFGVDSAALIIGGRRHGGSRFFRVPGANGGEGFKATVVTVPTTVAAGRVTVVLEAAGRQVAQIPLEVTAREFHSETIRLAPALTGLVREVCPARTAQAQRLWAVLGSVGSDAHFLGNFIRPVTSTRRTSPFGARRIYVHANGSRSQSIHTGIDYGVPTWTPVFASGSGRVVLAYNRIVSGKTVIIEHLPGVFSLYYHLDSIGVREGDLIEVGSVLGLSGNTGFSTGAHLHWEVRVFGEITDPDAFVARPLVDRAAILGRLNYRGSED